MADLESCGRHFRQKTSAWAAADGTVNAHLGRVGTEGLVAEFRADPGFGVVCGYFATESGRQDVQDLRFTELRSEILQSLAGDPGLGHGRRPSRVVDVLLHASAQACGFTAFAERLVRVAGALPR